MGIFQLLNSVRAANGLVDVSYPALVYSKNDATLGILPPTSTQDYTTLYKINPDIYRAVNVKASSIAQLPFKVYQRTADGVEDVSDDPEFKIFKTYNRFQTHYQFWEAVKGSLETTGESIWLLNYVNGILTEMTPLRTDLVKVIPHNDFLISYYSYDKGGQEIKIPPENIFHLKYWNPESAYRGLSPINAAKGDPELFQQSVGDSVIGKFEKKSVDTQLSV